MMNKKGLLITALLVVAYLVMMGIGLPKVLNASAALDMQLTAGQDGIVTCDGAAVDVELIDDLSVSVRCLVPTPTPAPLDYFLPVQTDK